MALARVPAFAEGSVQHIPAVKKGTTQKLRPNEGDDGGLSLSTPFFFSSFIHLLSLVDMKYKLGWCNGSRRRCFRLQQRV